MHIHAIDRVTRSGRLGVIAAVFVAGALLPLQGCDVSEKLLEAPDPDLVNPGDLENPEGAEAIRVGALSRWRDARGGDNTNGDGNTRLRRGWVGEGRVTA